MKLKELFFDESKWTRGAYARYHGEPIEPDACEAECWCLSGAIAKCYPENNHVILATVTKKLGYDDTEHLARVITWNDDPRRKFEEIKELVEELDL